MRLEWTGASFTDRIAIFDYIAADNPRAARATDDRLQEEARRLISFPYTGRVGRLRGIRELVVTGTPYIAAYIITDDAVRILRVIHGAQQWPRTMSRKL